MNLDDLEQKLRSLQPTDVSYCPPTNVLPAFHRHYQRLWYAVPVAATALLIALVYFYAPPSEPTKGSPSTAGRWKNNVPSPFGGGLGWGETTQEDSALTPTLSQRERGLMCGVPYVADRRSATYQLFPDQQVATVRQLLIAMTKEMHPAATELEPMEYPVIELTVAERGVRCQELGVRISSPTFLLLNSNSYLLPPNF